MIPIGTNFMQIGLVFTLLQKKLLATDRCGQGHQKQLGSGAATGNQNIDGGLGSTVSPRTDPGQSPGGVSGCKAPKALRISSSRNPKMMMLFEYLGSWCEDH